MAATSAGGAAAGAVSASSATLSLPGAASHAASGNAGGVPAAHPAAGAAAANNAPAAPAVAARRGPLLTVPWLVGALLELVVDACLPDPLPILLAVDAIDETVLRLQQSDNRSTNNDYISQMARVRRVIFELRGMLNRKEHLLLQLLSSAVRSSYVMKHEGANAHYKVVLASLTRVSDRLDYAREALAQSHSNMVSLISTQQARSSNEMNFQMKVLNIVTVVTAPINVLTGLFGVNVSVPWQWGVQDGPGDVVPFIVISVVIVAWLAVSLPLMFWVLGVLDTGDDDNDDEDDERDDAGDAHATDADRWAYPRRALPARA